MKEVEVKLEKTLEQLAREKFKRSQKKAEEEIS